MSEGFSKYPWSSGFVPKRQHLLEDPVLAHFVSILHQTHEEKSVIPKGEKYMLECAENIGHQC